MMKRPPAATAISLLRQPPYTAAVVMAVLIGLIALAASELATVPAVHRLGIGALPLSIVLGMLLAALPLTERLRAREGAARVQQTAQKTWLQAGIVLFGFQLSLTDLHHVGWQALLADVLVIAVILPLGIWLGHRLLKLPLSLTVLLATGSAVCGAAAILATAPVLGRYLQDGESTEQQNQSVGLAVAAVALFGTLSVLLYPQVQQWLGLNAGVTGIYIGSTIHEVAQAVAATDALSTATQHNAVIVKLLRVVMLAPVLILLALWLQQETPTARAAAGGQHKISVPGFVLLFLAVVVINTLLPQLLADEVLQTLRQFATRASALLLALAMAALGLNIRWLHLRGAGWRPVLLGAVLWLVLLLGGGLFFSLLQALSLI